MFSVCSLLADTTTRTTFELGRISSNADWLLPGGIFAALAVFVIVLYIFDCRRLGAMVAIVLISLRLAAAVGLLVLYAEPQWRSERQITKNSRVLLLADTSRSMGRSDATDTSGGAATRSAQLIAELSGGKMLDELRGTHDVTVARFDRDTSQIVTLDKLASSTNQVDTPVVDARFSQPDPVRNNLRYASAGGFAFALLCVFTYPLIWLLSGRNLTPWPSALLAATGLLAGAISLAWLDLGNPHTQISRLMDLPEPVVGWLAWEELVSDEEAPAAKPEAVDDAFAMVHADSIDWVNSLAPQGSETRLGDALRRWIYDSRNAPVSGVIVISDGGLNAGVDAQAAIALAKSERIKVFCVGMGSTDRPVNVSLANMIAPARAYPGDNFEITGILQAEGLAGRKVTVELTSRDARDADSKGGGRSEGVQQVTLGDDGRDVLIKFEVDNTSSGEPTNDSGPTTKRRLYTLKIDAPPKDTNARDNQREQLVEIVDRKNRVLLLASGPTREFRFLRNMLHRDDDTTVDVLLQTARDGIVQDAAQVLDEFPISPTELGEYDTLIAFDFDWRVLDQEQIDLLEAWVAEQAGGLILVAGPVHTSAWANDRNERRKLTSTLR